MADFLQPDSDGALGPDMNEWRKGLLYTAKAQVGRVDSWLGGN